MACISRRAERVVNRRTAPLSLAQRAAARSQHSAQDKQASDSSLMPECSRDLLESWSALSLRACVSSKPSPAVSDRLLRSTPDSRTSKCLTPLPLPLPRWRCDARAGSSAMPVVAITRRAGGGAAEERRPTAVPFGALDARWLARLPRVIAASFFVDVQSLPVVRAADSGYLLVRSHS